VIPRLAVEANLVLFSRGESTGPEDAEGTAQRNRRRVNSPMRIRQVFITAKRARNFKFCI
jgi:hypothetical protein